MPILDKCCFCVPLPTGGVILGVLGVLNSLCGIILPSFALIFLNDIYAAAQDSNNNVTDDDLRVVRLLARIIFFSIIIVFISVFISSILLIIGSIKKRKELILPYLITEAIGIFFTLLYFINNVGNGLNVAESIVLAIIYLLYSGYLWLCVFSLYQWIKEKSLPPAGVAPTGGVVPGSQATPYNGQPATVDGLYPQLNSTMA